MEVPSNLSSGIISTTYSVLYSAPSRAYVKTSVLTFANQGTQCVLNVYKRSRGILTNISPKDFDFKPYYMAQESSAITLEPGDTIEAVCNIINGVNYNINGVIIEA